MISTVKGSINIDKNQYIDDKRPDLTSSCLYWLKKKCEPVYSEEEWCDYLEGSYWIYQSNISDACVANVVIRNFSMIEKHGLLSMMFKEAEYSWYIWLFLMMFGWDITGVQANLSYAECRDFFSATAEFIYTGFCACGILIWWRILRIGWILDLHIYCFKILYLDI